MNEVKRSLFRTAFLAEYLEDCVAESEKADVSEIKDTVLELIEKLHLTENFRRWERTQGGAK